MFNGHRDLASGTTLELMIVPGAPTAPVTTDQQVPELSQRLQLSQGIASTPGIQRLIDPADNPFEDRIRGWHQGTYELAGAVAM